MNKKIWVLVLFLFFLVIIDNQEVSAASEYNGYSEVMLQEGKLLANFTDSEYEEYYEEVEKTKFWGWNVYLVCDNTPLTYIARTAYETINMGEEEITYEVDVTCEEESRTVLDASGSIGYDLSGKTKTFKHDLDAKISLGYKHEETESIKKTEKLKIPVEGKTKLLVTIVGEGVVTNGVACYYMFWLQNMKGGFEYFTITNEYQKIEKVPYE